MTEEQKSVLISKVRNKCYITDTSAETESRVVDMVEDAIIEMSYLLGIRGEFDFSIPSKERSLLLNYCFYVWNDSADEFKPNYLSDILTIRHANEVNQSEKTQEE